MVCHAMVGREVSLRSRRPSADPRGNRASPRRRLPIVGRGREVRLAWACAVDVARDALLAWAASGPMAVGMLAICTAVKRLIGSVWGI